MILVVLATIHEKNSNDIFSDYRQMTLIKLQRIFSPEPLDRLVNILQKAYGAPPNRKYLKSFCLDRK